MEKILVGKCILNCFRHFISPVSLFLLSQHLVAFLPCTRACAARGRLIALSVSMWVCEFVCEFVETKMSSLTKLGMLRMLFNDA